MCACVCFVCCVCVRVVFTCRFIDAVLCVVVSCLMLCVRVLVFVVVLFR